MLLKGQLEEAQLENVTSDPANLPEGRAFVNTTDHKAKIVLNGTTHEVVTNDQTQTLTGKNISAADNNIDLTDSIRDADIAADAAIDLTKLDTLAPFYSLGTNDFGVITPTATTVEELESLVGISSNVQSQLNAKQATGNYITALTGDVTASGPGSATATISNLAHSKMAALTVSRALVSDGSGIVAPSAVTATELGYVSGATSNLQSQLNTNATNISTNSSAISTHVANVSNPHSVTKSQVGLGNVDNTSDATKNAAAATLTNKTLTAPILTTPTIDVATLTGQGSTPSSPSAGSYKAYVKSSTNKFTILDSSGNETAVGAGGGGINYIANGDGEAGITGWSTYSDRTLISAITTGTPGTLVMGTVSGLSVNQAVQICATVTMPTGLTAGTTYYISSIAGFNVQLATTAGGSAIAITSSGSGTLYLVPQAPCRMVGATPNGSDEFQISTTTTTPLYGNASLTLSKANATVLGCGGGAYYAFTLQQAHFAKVLNISFDYIVSSGTFNPGTSTSNGDLTVWIYDGTNVIQPSTFKLDMNSTSIAGKFIATFQTSASATSYKLLFHQSGSSNNAYTLKVDNIIVSPQTVQVGAFIGDFQSYTPTVTGVTTSGATGRYRRVGDSIEVFATIPVTGSSSGQITLALPSGMSIDTTKANGSRQPLGQATAFINVSPFNYAGIVFYNSATTVSVSNGAASTSFWGSTAPATWSSGDTAQLHFTAPVVGFGTSQILSSDSSEGRVVAGLFSRAATQSIPNVTSTILVFDTVEGDSHGKYSAGTYTVAVPGWYKITAQASFAVNSTGGRELYLFKNSVLSKLLGYQGSPSAAGPTVIGNSVDIPLVAGDQIRIEGYQSSGGSLNVGGNAALTYFSISKIAGNQQIAASEYVGAKWSGNATGTIASALSSSTSLVFPTKAFDSHGFWNGTTATIPVSGKFAFKGNVAFAGTFSAGGYTGVGIYVDGVLVSETYTITAAGQGSSYVPVSDEIPILAGQSVTFRGASNGTGLSITGGVLATRLSIVRTGNY